MADTQRNLSNLTTNTKNTVAILPETSYNAAMQIYLAPMEGITGYIVRNAFYHHFGYIDKYFTPFIPAAKRMSAKILRDLAPEHNAGIRLVPQLISNQSAEVLDMIRQLRDLGFTEVNLNLGCPSGTVVSKRRGSGMLQDPEELDRFLSGIFERADIPVSVKTRIGFRDPDAWPQILEIYRRYPIAELIIHPRLRSEQYAGLPHLEAFELAYQTYSGRLCYNGDLWDMNRYQEIRTRFPDTDTVMIGRGLLGRPYLAWQIQSTEGGVSDPSVDLRSLDPKQIRIRLHSFLDEIYQGYLGIFSGEKDVCMHMKEIWVHLGNSFQDSDRLIRKLMKSRTPSEYQALVSQIFDTLELAPLSDIDESSPCG